MQKEEKLVPCPISDCHNTMLSQEKMCPACIKQREENAEIRDRDRKKSKRKNRDEISK
ncbi:hypothetical protein HNV12_01445 [Methanococcoides sp. SA1]|nr:hypothetical protein [Methanococcoides sp. SA1]